MTTRYCACGCGAVLERAAGESPQHFAARRTTGKRRCIDIYRGNAVRAALTAADELKPTDKWPAAMAVTKPFADDVRTRAAGHIGLPATLAGGCSSSSGWGI